MDADISNSISALSVLFGVAVFHLGASSTKITKALELETPEKSLVHARRSNRQTVCSALLMGALPNFLMLTAILVVMSPRIIDHLMSYQFSIVDFNFMVTLFQIVGFIVVFYTSLSFGNVARLTIKWAELW